MAKTTTAKELRRFLEGLPDDTRLTMPRVVAENEFGVDDPPFCDMESIKDARKKMMEATGLDGATITVGHEALRELGK